MNEKILLVDDEPDILETFKRNLRKKFRIDTALGPMEGLKAVAANGPYAVIVSDMRMPGMDGIQFLSKVKESAPDSVRMMLTGNTDLGTAMGAVNEGSIFQFLTKPCPPEVFEQALKAGIRQYQLVTAERELLEKTLSRSVKVLIDILSMVSPLAFARTIRLRRYVGHMVEQLHLSKRWQYELAALLSQIGCVKLASETLEKIYVGQSLSEAEQDAFTSHPFIGAKMLRRIPRLEEVAGIIEKQMKPFSEFDRDQEFADADPIEIGAQILKVSLDFDQLVIGGMPHNDAVETMMEQPNMYNPQIVSLLHELKTEKKETLIKLVKIDDLQVGMIVAEDIQTNSSRFLLLKGQKITSILLERLKSLSLQGSVPDEIRVSVPVSEKTG